VHAVLLGGDSPLYLSARMSVTGEYDSNSEVSDTPPRSSSPKIAAKYLAPYLETRDRAAAR
jgi:hypothetical protein